MTLLATIILTLIAMFCAFALLVRMDIKDAEDSGELRLRTPGFYPRRTIRRDEEPELFERGIRSLRATPWIAASLASFGILLGSFLL